MARSLLETPELWRTTTDDSMQALLRKIIDPLVQESANVCSWMHAVSDPRYVTERALVPQEMLSRVGSGAHLRKADWTVFDFQAVGREFLVAALHLGRDEEKRILAASVRKINKVAKQAAPSCVGVYSVYHKLRGYFVHTGVAWKISSFFGHNMSDENRIMHQASKAWAASTVRFINLECAVMPSEVRCHAMQSAVLETLGPRSKRASRFIRITGHVAFAGSDIHILWVIFYEEGLSGFQLLHERCHPRRCHFRLRGQDVSGSFLTCSLSRIHLLDRHRWNQGSGSFFLGRKMWFFVPSLRRA